MTTDKYTYSIFQSRWWLDAVAPNEWDEIVVRKSNDIIARMPYTLRQRYGLLFVEAPALTNHLGPWIAPITGKEYNIISRQNEIQTEIINRLPKFDIFKQSFNPMISNWLPWHWAGYTQTTFYTYVIDDLDDLDRIYSGFTNEKRRDIKKASNKVNVCEDMPPAEFYRLHKLSLSQGGSPISYKYEKFMRICRAAISNNSGKILYAIDSDGAVHSGVFFVWDSNSAYFLISFNVPEYRSNGSLSLLIYEAIKHCSGKTKRFDFDGSMIKGAEHSYRAFGGKQTPYFQISHTPNALLRLAKALRGS